MSLIATLDVEHADLALTPTIRSTPVSIAVVSHSGTDPETGMFFFLVEDEQGRFEEFEATLDEDHTVAAWRRVASSETTRIYRLRHTPTAILLSPKTTELGGLMMEAKSTDRGWTIRVQLPDRAALGDLWEFCEREGIDFELGRLYSVDEFTVDDEGDSLTDAQREALVTAHRMGYFKEPREVSLAELATELGISPTAVGGRIRRGTDRLVERTLADEE
ncbi:MAG: helix-turn-helix domain-containing protein [Haloplanus sp.]